MSILLYASVLKFILELRIGENSVIKTVMSIVSAIFLNIYRTVLIYSHGILYCSEKDRLVKLKSTISICLADLGLASSFFSKFVIQLSYAKGRCR